MNRSSHQAVHLLAQTALGYRSIFVGIIHFTSNLSDHTLTEVTSIFF